MNISTLAAALLALSAGAAMAQTQPSIDANGDGKITAAEFRTARTNLIMGADANKDGVVTSAELNPVVADVSGSLDVKPKADRVFSRIDVNQDGALTRAEVEAVVDRRFRSLDANGNGVLSAAERQAWKAPIN